MCAYFKQPKIVLTDIDGRYRLDIASMSDRGVLVACKDGYGDAREPWEPKHADNGPVTSENVVREYNFTLTAEHWISGTILDQERNPLPGLVVEASGAKSYRRHRTLSDQHGRFRLDGLPEDQIHLCVSEGEHARYSRFGHTADEDVEIVLNSKRMIRGRVVDAVTNDRIKHFSVGVDLNNVFNSLTQSEPGVWRSTSDGRFEIDGLGPVYGIHQTPGYVIWIESPGYEDLRQVVETASEPDEAEEIVFALKSEEEGLNGILVDAETQAPLADILVHCVSGWTVYPNWKWIDRSGSNAIVSILPVRTDEDGRFEILENDYCFMIHAPGYARMALQPENQMRDPQSGELRIALQRAASISGVFYYKGRPNRASLFVRKKTPRGYEDFPNVSADAQGIFRIEDISAGTYTLHFNPPDGTQRRVSLLPGEQKSIVFDPDAGPCRLNGKILFEGSPRSGSVKLTPEFDDPYASRRTWLSPTEGYSFEGLQLGKYILSVYAHDGQLMARVRVLVGFDTERNLDIRRRLRGQIIYARETPPNERPNIVQIELKKIADIDGSAITAERIPTDSVTIPVQKGKFSVLREFHGKYEMTFLAQYPGQCPFNTSCRLPFDLNNYDRDQDQGEIIIPLQFNDLQGETGGGDFN